MVAFRRIQAHEQDDATESRRLMTSEREEHQGPNQVRPTDQTQNPIPLRMDGEWTERDDPVAIRAAKCKGEIDQQRPAKESQPPGQSLKKPFSTSGEGRESKVGRA